MTIYRQTVGYGVGSDGGVSTSVSTFTASVLPWENSMEDELESVKVRIIIFFIILFWRSVLFSILTLEKKNNSRKSFLPLQTPL